MKLIQKVVIKNDDKFLILLKSPNSRNFPNVWEFPGGKSENGEDLIESLKREVLEETGLRIEVGDLIKTINFKFKEEDRVYKIFSGKVISGEIKLSKEHTEFRWANREELMKLELHSFMKKFFQQDR